MKIVVGGPNTCKCNASDMSPFKLAVIDLVRKQVGHGIPVACLTGHDHPGSQAKFFFRNK